MAFYITLDCGHEIRNGKNFATQDEAEASALQYAKRSAAQRGWVSPLYVRERTPGRAGKAVAIVRPSGIERTEQ